jgi:anti-anti-sigma regulatory factor
MESANKSVKTLLVAICDKSVWVKISGRANFTSSLDLKNLVQELWDRSYRCFIFDLSDCIIMDSTFLGVLAGIGLQFAEANKQGDTCSVQLANSNERISDLLENLGVIHLFQIVTATNPETGKFEPLSGDGEPSDRTEVTRTCLEAHRTLMNINPANIIKFKDVTQFLAEDLKKLEQAKGS